MAKSHNNTGRARNGPPFVQLHHWMRKTDAWRSLNPYAKLVYIEMKAHYTGANNGDISYSYRQAQEDLGCSNKPIPGAFSELQDRGFVVAVQKGSFSWKTRFGQGGRATTWRLTELPQDYPERSLSPTHDFKTWVPSPEPEKKTRHAQSVPDARSKRAIPETMARPKRTYDTPRAGHSGLNGDVDGTLKAGTYRSTISPQPIGVLVSDALANSKLVRKASEMERQGSRRDHSNPVEGE